MDNFDESKFKTLQIQGYVNFYRYYIDNEIPDPHDHADLWHISYLPYCKFGIIEQRMCSVLNRIQRKNSMFTNVVIRDNRWLEKELPVQYRS